MQQLEHGSGPLEIGRGPRLIHERLTLDDPYLSRDHLRIEELQENLLRIANISRTNAVIVGEGDVLAVGEVLEIELPTVVKVGELVLEIESDAADATSTDSWERDLARTALDPWMLSRRGEEIPKLRDLGEAPTAERLAQWFERVLAVQQAAAGSAEFYGEAARALVDLIGLDRGCVLLARGDNWDVAAEHTTRPGLDRRFSRGVLREVTEQRRTIYRSLDNSDPRSSLIGIEAVVASPILDSGGAVLGILYGTRSQDLDAAGVDITPLEAQVVQLLAAAAGAGLARQEREAETARMRVQFEQFFSPELVLELERDPSLLEGRNRELTVLFADLRGFSSISEQLGPRETYRLMRDVMDRLTTPIIEHGGAIIDYYGDGVAVMWNAPANQPDHALAACRAALAMREALPELNATWQAPLGRALDLGVGINTGPALVGNSGSSRRLKYGPRGHTVNLASRVEGATRQLGAPIILTGTTAERLAGALAIRRLCQARLAGVSEAVALYELPPQPPPDDWLQYRAASEAGLACFEAGRWAQAVELLEPLSAAPRGASDPVVAQLLCAARDYQQAPPGEFEAVIELKSK